jgi:hypothetical protein
MSENTFDASSLIGNLPKPYAHIEIDGIKETVRLVDEPNVNTVEVFTKHQIETAFKAFLAGQEPYGYFRSQPFGWEDCGEHDEGAKPLYEVPPDAAALVASLQALSVTNIMIDVVPGDGSGHEVYAKSVEQVEALLNILALELDKHEHNSPIAKLRITDKGEHSLHLLALANSVKDPEAAFKALIARLGVGEFELCLKVAS